MQPEGSKIFLIFIIGTLMLLLISTYAIILLFYYRKKQLKNIKEKESLKLQYEREILQSQIEVQNATLQHIGQELHDNIGQLLSVARLNLTVVEDIIDSTDNQFYIKQANELVAQSLNDLRSLSKSLDGDFVADFGLHESIAQELNRIRRTQRFDTEFVLLGQPYSIGFQPEIVVFRIAQEILTNALKHSNATLLTAKLSYEPTLLSLQLFDNGKGFDYQLISQNPIGQSGAGLRNMQRRANLIGGNCQIESTLGQGTRITIAVPYTPVA